MPFGNEPSGATGVNPSLGMPAIQPFTPVATPDAVNALISAYRNGVISTRDIMDRLGPVGESQRQATIKGNQAQVQSAREFMSPAQVQARQAAVAAQTAQSGLTGQQATAQTGLVNPATFLQSQALAKAQAEAKWGAGTVDAFQQWGPWLGHKEVPTNQDGTPDYGQMAQIGRQFLSPIAMREWAMSGLKADPNRSQEFDTPQGKGKKIFNQWGLEITPGSEGERVLSRLLQMTPNSQPASAPAAGTTLVRPRGEPQIYDEPPAPMKVTSASQFLSSQDRANLYNKGVPLAAINQLSDQDINALVQPKNAILPADEQQQRPSVMPAGALGTVGQYNPDVGTVLAGPKGAFQTPEDITKDLHIQKPYENWAQQKGFLDAFMEQAQRVQSMTPQEQNKANMNQIDMGLAESLIKLFDPQGVIREFKWDKLEDSQPLYSRLQNAVPLLLRKGVFTPDTRTNLIRMGEDLIHSRETGAKDVIDLAAKRGEAAGLNPQSFLTDDEHRLHQGNFTHVAPPAASAAASQGPIVDIPGVGKVYRGADGQYHRAE